VIFSGRAVTVSAFLLIAIRAELTGFISGLLIEGVFIVVFCTGAAGQNNQAEKTITLNTINRFKTALFFIAKFLSFNIYFYR
jgi:hypothetical protein